MKLHAVMQMKHIAVSGSGVPPLPSPTSGATFRSSPALIIGRQKSGHQCVPTAHQFPLADRDSSWLDSIIMTSVLGSGFAEQEKSGKSRTQAGESRRAMNVKPTRKRGPAGSMIRRGDSKHRKSFPGSLPAWPLSRKTRSKPAGSTFRKPTRQMPQPLWLPKAIETRRRISASLPAARVPSSASRRGWRFVRPPPDTIISWKERFATVDSLTTDFEITNRRTASVIDRAVSAVAVATTSSLRARPHRRRNSRTNSRPNSSRPAVFGGFCAKKCTPQHRLDNRFDHIPRRRNLSAAIQRPPKKGIRHRIYHHVSGPGIKSETRCQHRPPRESPSDLQFPQSFCTIRSDLWITKQ